MEYDEINILKDCLHAYKSGEGNFFEKVSELTGIHLICINDFGKLMVVQDCGGMKSCYFGVIQNEIFITSHPQLVGDILDLNRDPFVQKLTAKWYFSKGSKYLPGNISPYKEIKRLGPNTFLEFIHTFKIVRFYPLTAHKELQPEAYEKTQELIKDLIHKNIKLCTLKWQKPAISLSGGMDSKTTLASANGLYDKIKFYSYHCKPSELEDADAAHNICKTIGLNHKIYPIPESSKEIEDFELLKKIIIYNSSNIGVPYDHEIRKFIFFYRLNEFDVELKSWISEVGRAMWERKYGVTLPNVLTPRHFSIFQTRYIFSQYLLSQSDKYYREYLNEIKLLRPPFNYEHADLFYWEFRFGSWGTTVTTTHDIFNHTATMPMNNRKLIDMFLWFPHQYRQHDKIHENIIMSANKKVMEEKIYVHNPYLGKKRIFMEKLFLQYHTLFQFQ